MSTHVSEITTSRDLGRVGSQCIKVGVFAAECQRLAGDFNLKVLLAELAGSLIISGSELRRRGDRLNIAVLAARPELCEWYPIASTSTEAIARLNAECQSIEGSLGFAVDYSVRRSDWLLNNCVRSLLASIAQHRQILLWWMREGATDELSLYHHLDLVRDCEIDRSLNPSLGQKTWIGTSNLKVDLIRSWYLSANAYLEITSIDIVSDLIVEAMCRHQEPHLAYELAHQLLDEARHAHLLACHLGNLGFRLGCVPVSLKTWALYRECGSLAEKLAAQQVVQEAVGLEVSTLNVERMRSAGDLQAAELFFRIAADEMNHVSLGLRWLHHFAPADASDIVVRVNALSDGIAATPDVPVIPELRAKAGFPAEWIQEEIYRRGCRSLQDALPADFRRA